MPATDAIKPIKIDEIENLSRHIIQNPDKSR